VEKIGIVVGFAPFIVFFALMKIATPLAGLAAAFAVSAVITGLDWRRSGGVKVLGLGSLILFGATTLYTLAAAPAWSVGGLRLVIDGGLTLISFTSQVTGRPFTLQYAKEQVPQQYWDSPVFLRTNQIITGAWTLAFAIVTASDAAAAYIPEIPLWLEIAVSVAALVGAVWFTFWYRDRVRRLIA